MRLSMGIPEGLSSVTVSVRSSNLFSVIEYDY